MRRPATVSISIAVILAILLVAPSGAPSMRSMPSSRTAQPLSLPPSENITVRFLGQVNLSQVSSHPNVTFVDVDYPTNASAFFAAKRLANSPSYQTHNKTVYDDRAFAQSMAYLSTGDPSLTMIKKYSGTAGSGLDVGLAVGPANVVETTNDGVRVFDKTGTLVADVSSGSLFSCAKICQFSDPFVIFDSTAQAWFASILNIYGCPGGGYCTTVRIAVAPPMNGVAQPFVWNVYDFGSGNACHDQPYLGESKDLLIVTAAHFQYCDGGGGTYLGSDISLFSKNDLLAGNPYTGWGYGFLSDPRLGLARPVQTLASSINAYVLITSPLGTTSAYPNGYLWSFNLSQPGNFYSFEAGPEYDFVMQPLDTAPDAIQAGTTTLISTGDSRVQSAVWDLGKVYFTLEDGCMPGGTDQHKIARSCIRLTELNPSSTLGVPIEDYDFAAPGYYYFYPALSVNLVTEILSSNNVKALPFLVAVFGSSSSTLTPDLRFTGRFENDPAGTFEASQLIEAGPVFNAQTDPTFGAARYGDYFGASSDIPSTIPTVWVAGEISGSPTTNFATRIAEVGVSISTGTLNFSWTVGLTAAITVLACLEIRWIRRTPRRITKNSR